MIKPATGKESTGRRTETAAHRWRPTQPTLRARIDWHLPSPLPHRVPNTFNTFSSSLWTVLSVLAALAMDPEPEDPVAAAAAAIAADIDAGRGLTDEQYRAILDSAAVAGGGGALLAAVNAGAERVVLIAPADTRSVIEKSLIDDFLIPVTPQRKGVIVLLPHELRASKKRRAHELPEGVEYGGNTYGGRCVGMGAGVLQSADCQFSCMQSSCVLAAVLLSAACRPAPRPALACSVNFLPSPAPVVGKRSTTYKRFLNGAETHRVRSLVLDCGAEACAAPCLSRPAAAPVHLPPPLPAGLPPQVSAWELRRVVQHPAPAAAVQVAGGGRCR